MTKQEARDELKETEGRPEVRSRIRSLQRAIATRRMMADVPKADVVVMNPTHYAVALRYDAGKMKAPRVVAKGADLDRVPDSPRRRGAQCADLRASAVRARAVPHERDRQGDLAAAVRRRRASAHLHLSADGPHGRGAKARRAPAQRKAAPKMPELDDRRRACSSRAAAGRDAEVEA